MDNNVNYAASRLFHVKNVDDFIDAMSGIDIEVEVQTVDGREEVYIYNEDGVWPGQDPDDVHTNSMNGPDKALMQIIAQHLQSDSVAVLETVVVRENAYTEMQAVNAKGDLKFTTNDLLAHDIVEQLGGNPRNEVR